MNIYDTAHKLAEEIRKSDECVHLAELRERAYADETNRLLLDEYKRLQVQLQMSMVGAAGEMPSEDMQQFQQLASLLYMNSDVQAYLMAEMQMQKTLADIFKILTEAAGIRARKALNREESDIGEEEKETPRPRRGGTRAAGKQAVRLFLV